MGVSLEKGGNVNLSKEAPGLTGVVIGCGWDVRSTDGEDYDLDASAVIVGKDGKVRNDDDFVFYGHLKTTDGAVEHTGDNLTGEGEGDDEQIKVDLSKLAADVDKVVFVVAIYEGNKRKQNFGQVKNAFVRVVDDKGSTELTRFDLAEDMGLETAMILGELYRHNDEWKFRAVGQGYKEDLS